MEGVGDGDRGGASDRCGVYGVDGNGGIASNGMVGNEVSVCSATGAADDAGVPPGSGDATDC